MPSTQASDVFSNLCVTLVRAIGPEMSISTSVISDGAEMYFPTVSVSSNSVPLVCSLGVTRRGSPWARASEGAIIKIDRMGRSRNVRRRLEGANWVMGASCLLFVSRQAARQMRRGLRWDAAIPRPSRVKKTARLILAVTIETMGQERAGALLGASLRWPAPVTQRLISNHGCGSG